MLRRFAAATLAVGFALVSGSLHAKTVAGVEIPPPLPPQPVSDTYFGTTVEDPYRFLEDTENAEVQAWMRAQADATSALLARIPGREALLARIKEIDDAVPAVIGQIHRDRRGVLVYLKRGPQENQFKLYRRERADREERLLVDPEVLARETGKPHAIGGFSVSPDGRYVAYTISASGTEIGTLHVVDAASGREATPPLDRIRFAAMIWLDDASGFFYLRLAEGYEKRPRVERFMDTRTYLRVLAKPDADRVVFGPGVHADIPLDRSDTGFVGPFPGHDAAFAIVSHGVQREESLYVSPLQALLEGRPRWRKVYDASAGIHEMAYAGRWLYLRSAKDAPRFKVLRTSIERPSLEAARVILPEGDAVITDIGASGDALYVARREGVEKKLYRVSHDTAATTTRIALPVTGNVRIVNAHARAGGAVLALGGWTRATRHYALDERGRARDLALAPVGPFDAPPMLVAREARVKSHDGVEVPVSIIHARGAKLDGSHPLIVYGYGAYGVVEEPGLSPRLLAWIERGGVFAIAHVRGGGVFGDAWRRAGFKGNQAQHLEGRHRGRRMADRERLHEPRADRGVRRQRRRHLRRARDHRAAGPLQGRGDRGRQRRFDPLGDARQRRRERSRVRHGDEGGRVQGAARDEPVRQRRARHRVSRGALRARRQRQPRRRLDAAQARVTARRGDDERRPDPAATRLRRRARDRCDARAGAAAGGGSLELPAVAGGRAGVPAGAVRPRS
jgi:prolyl oligopeptidase